MWKARPSNSLKVSKNCTAISVPAGDVVRKHTIETKAWTSSAAASVLATVYARHQCENP